MDSVLALISGGIDSPVATYLIGRLGYKTIPLYFDNDPFSDERSKKRMFECVKKLKEYLDIDYVIVVPHGHSLLEFSDKCERRLTCVLCKRMMYRIGERLCKKFEAKAIVTGEFLGSKASQTLDNLKVISQAIDTPVLRPLLGLDKQEIEKIGKEIGTFSSSPSSGCSIVPDKPSTKARLERVLEEEKRVDIEVLIGKSIERMKKINID